MTRDDDTRASGRPGNPRTSLITGTALLLALGVALPIVFHAFPLGGRIFLPMHLPAFIAGLVLGPASGFVVGACSPVLSTLIMGRPPVFLMVPMIFEIATYGLVAGLVRRRMRGARRAAVPARAGWAPSIYVPLLAAMAVGRGVWFCVVVWLAPVLGIQARSAALALGALGAGWIGMVIQLALVPPIVRAIERLRGA